MIEQLESEKKDYMPIIRAVIKMSSALTESDSIEHGKYYKFKFKKRLREWLEIYENMSKPIMKLFIEDGESALIEAYNRFSELAEGVENFGIIGSDRADLIGFYAKVKSALNDLKEVDFETGGIMTFILSKQTISLIKSLEGQYRDIFSVTDKDGNNVNELVNQYDELGKAMFVNDEL